MNDFHNDKNSFKDAIIYTQKKSGFPSKLIEKDYYCSLILKYLYSFDDTKLIFKGGTCLSKVYSDFYRMSEDLDFSIPTETGTKRGTRRANVKNFKARISKINEYFPIFEISKQPVGANVSTQYIAELSYNSLFSSDTEKIKIEVGLREPVIDAPTINNAKTLLINPFTDQPVIAPFPIKCLSLEELFAEKIRAALTRRIPAIRDIYDLDYAVQNSIIYVNNKNLINILKEKLLVDDTTKINVSNEKKHFLLNQVDTELKAVLRNADFNNFNFERAFDLLVQIADNL